MRFFVVALAVGVVALPVSCALTTDLSGLSTGGADNSGQDASSADSSPESAVSDSGTDDAGDASSDAASDADASKACTCTNLVSAYRFSATNGLGLDAVGSNHMTTVLGTPKQSTVVPPGRSGHSIELDGASAVCISSGFTFAATANHTLCWWAQPAALSDNTNQFAQTCGYDTWTTSSGADYLWRINNCNGGSAANLQVPGVYSVGAWVQICQTYDAASMKRTVVIDGKTNQKVSVTDSVPIVERTTDPWCIGSYYSGGFWTGRIYLPLWFDRILNDAEIEQVNATACCLP